MVRLSILLGISIILYANAVLAASSANLIVQTEKAQPERLQIGEAWSRVQYDGKYTSTDALNKVIAATARVDLKDQRGTSFYLGQYGEEHLMLTNYHVMSSVQQCRSATVYFRESQKRFRCGRIVKAFADTESTFFTIRVSTDQTHFIRGKELPFDFSSEYKPGHKLVVAGYGIYGNPKDNLTLESSQTCVVVSTTFAPRKLSIKSKSDNKVYTAYSFAHACEISNGDSGAALMSEITGKVVGLNWATSTAKPTDLLKSPTVFDWIEKNDPRIWNSLSYGIPALNIAVNIHNSDDILLKQFVQANVAENLQ